jgi:hypothetical protein
VEVGETSRSIPWQQPERDSPLDTKSPPDAETLALSDSFWPPQFSIRQIPFPQVDFPPSLTYPVTYSKKKTFRMMEKVNLLNGEVALLEDRSIFNMPCLQEE